MECNEKISVIIPIYNVENYLYRCLETIIHQTYTNLEIILVNDGSTDKSLNICKDFQSKDSRIVLISQKNSGVTAARNTGLARATGDYIAWADPDDWADLDMFESVMEIIRRTRTELLICDCFLSYDDSETMAHSVAPDNKESRASQYEAMQWLVKGNTGLWACFAARKLFDNFFFPTLHIAEDTYAYSYLIEKCSFVIFSPLRKYHYYQKRNESLTHKKSCQTFLDSLCMLGM